MPNSQSELRVMLVDDDEFSLAILSEAMQSWAKVLCVSSITKAITQIEPFQPNVVVTDLNFNGGPDGSQMLKHLYENYPWIGRVILTSHAAPMLVLGRDFEVPPETVYLVKADVSKGSDLKDAIYEALLGKLSSQGSSSAAIAGRVKISKSQAQVLKLIASGLSNAAIADELQITLRAAEGLIQRTFAALNLKPDEKTNIRVLATRIWLEGKVTVK